MSLDYKCPCGAKNPVHRDAYHTYLRTACAKCGAINIVMEGRVVRSTSPGKEGNESTT